MAKIVYESENELKDLICKWFEDGENPIDHCRFDYFIRDFNIGDYVVPDIVTFEKTYKSPHSLLDICVVVVKSDKVTPDDVGQLVAYMHSLHNFIEYWNYDPEKDYEGWVTSVFIYGILVAPEVTFEAGELVYIRDDLRAFTVDFSLEGGVRFIVGEHTNSPPIEMSTKHQNIVDDIIADAEKEREQQREQQRKKDIIGNNVLCIF